MAHIARKSTCALADDGLYCLSEDGRWGARVRFAPGAPGIGDVALAAPPALVKGGGCRGRHSSGLARAGCASLPPDGLLLQLQVGLTWLVAVPEPDGWFAALTQALGGPAALPQLSHELVRGSFHLQVNGGHRRRRSCRSGGRAMDSTHKNRRQRTTTAAVLLAVVTTVGCGARRGRLVAWRPADVKAPAGEPTARGARTYRVALPPSAAGERPMRAELVFASALDGAQVDAVGLDGQMRRPLLSRGRAAGDRVVVPLAGAHVQQVEVVLRGQGAAPSLSAARVATEMPISWPDGARRRIARRWLR